MFHEKKLNMKHSKELALAGFSFFFRLVESFKSRIKETKRHNESKFILINVESKIPANPYL